MGGMIVVCCDGTWNKADDQTNVHRTYRLLARCLTGGSEQPIGDDRLVTRGRAPDGRQVYLYYDTGVGTRRWQRGSGGLFGAGLGKNIRQAYSFLAENAAPDDELFVFGFSRGAFTVRSLCGQLGCAGLPRTYGERAVADAWAFYRTPPAKRPARGEALAEHEPRDASVRFLGVYDTVGSLGVPVPQLRWLNGLAERALGGVIRFHDTALGRNVETACHALAIHERRGTFKPVVWSRAPGRVRRPDGTSVEQRVLQVWFAGSHANVGGGYPQTDLSDIAFEWMMRRAMDAGLQVPEETLSAAVNGNCYGFRHDSDRGWLGRLTNGELLQTARTVAGSVPLGYLGLTTRALDFAANLFTVRSTDRRIGGEIEADDGTFCVPVGERVHASVVERYRGEHVPEPVRKALAAGVPVFRERAERRDPCDGAKVRVNGVECPLRDSSPSGARVGDAGRLKEGAEVSFQSLGHGNCTAKVVWRRGAEAGLSVVSVADAVESVPRRGGSASPRAAGRNAPARNGEHRSPAPRQPRHRASGP